MLIGSCDAVKSTTAQFKILLFFVFETGLFSYPRETCMQSTNMVTALLESGDLHTTFRTSMLRTASSPYNDFRVLFSQDVSIFLSFRL